MNLKLQEYPRQYFYLSIFIVFIVLFIKKVTFIYIESIDLSVVNSILNPDSPKGKVIYDPHYHFNYIFAFFQKNIFNENINFKYNAVFFWLISEILVVFALIKISFVLFKRDISTAFLIILLYLTFRSGIVDQKTLATPFFLFSIYFYFINRFSLSAIFLGIVFYLHVGFGIWAAIPLSIGILYLNLFHKEKVKIKDLINFLLPVLIIISPIAYFYIFEILVAQEVFDNLLFKNFWYGNFYNSTIAIFKSKNYFLQVFILTFIIMIGIKLKNKPYENNKIFALVVGVFGVFFINYILCDVFFNGVAIKLQLLRSEIILRYLALMIFCYLITEQVKIGNFYIIFVFLILVIPNPIFFYYSYWKIQLSLYFLLSMYVIFENSKLKKYNIIKNYIQKINLLKKTELFFKNPNKIIFIVLILFIAQKSFSFSSLNNEIKEIFKNETLETKHTEKKDIYNFINFKMKDENFLFLCPFTSQDFPYFIKFKCFFSPSSLVDINLPKNLKIFEDILKNDFLINNFNLIKKQNFWTEIQSRIDESLLIKWKMKYGLTHAIMEKNKILNFPIVYEDKNFQIYDIR